jgi:hypothetical protein
VRWGLRVDIVDNDAKIVLEFDLGGNFASNDALKQGLH